MPPPIIRAPFFAVPVGARLVHRHSHTVSIAVSPWARFGHFSAFGPKPKKIAFRSNEFKRRILERATGVEPATSSLGTSTDRFRCIPALSESFPHRILKVSTIQQTFLT